jgi:Lrp/AsnC family leucine-responsive transcriptional regulator
MTVAHLNTHQAVPDDKDMEILQVLQENGRLSIREVAAKVNLSATPTQQRIRRLEQEGIILQYGALLNHKKVNKSIIVICEITLKEHNKKAGQHFIDQIMSFKEVVECYNIAGDFDFMLKVVTESMESYHSFYVNKLSEVAYISQTKSIFVMDVIKQTHKLV